MTWCVVVLGACGGDNNNASEQPLPQPAQLTDRGPEPAGANCAHGGTAIRIGLDKDGNGQLDADEVTDTEYVCTASGGILVRKDPLAPDASCPAGATAVKAGVDDNGDGVLQDAEIDQTATVCDPSEIWEGDFWDMPDQEPTMLARFQTARVVTGDLLMSGDAAIALPKLELVGGAVTITSTAAVALPKLATIGGDFTVGGTVSALDIPALENVHGEVVISTGGALAFSAPRLEHVSGGLHAEYAQLTSLDAPRLFELPGSLELGDDCDGAIGNCPLGACGLSAITEVHLPQLQFVQGCVIVAEAPQLGRVDTRLLFEVNGTFTIRDVPALTNLNVSWLGNGNVGDITIQSTGLTELSLPKLTQLFTRLEMRIWDNPALTSLILPGLVEGSLLTLDIQRSPVFSRLSAPVLQSLGGLDISTVETFDVPSLQSIAGLQVLAPRADFSGLAGVQSISFLQISGNELLTDLRAFRGLRTVGTLWLSGDPALVSLDGLESIATMPSTSSLLLENNPVLADATGLRNLQQIGTFFFQNNPSLTELQLPALRTLFGLFQMNSALTTLSGFDALEQVRGDILIQPRANRGISPDEIAAFLARLGKKPDGSSRFVGGL